MKKKLFLLFLVGFLLSCVQQHKAPDTGNDIAAIKAIYDEYFKYVEAGDLDNFMTLFDDNAMRGEPGIPTIMGKENIKERFSTLFSVADNQLTLIGEGKTEVSGDLAYGYCEVTLTSTPRDGSPVMQTDMKALTIFKRVYDGSWKIYIDNINFHPTWSQDTIPSDLLEEGNPYY